MPQIICPEKIICPCDENPVTGFSSDAPQCNEFIANVDFQGEQTLRLNQIFGQLNGQAFCDSCITQDAADDCARNEAQLFAWSTWRNQAGATGQGRPGTPISIFTNTFQSCKVLCPDGTYFTWTVEAGQVLGRSQEEANDLAQELACQRAQRRRICVTNTTLPPACQGTAYSQGISVTGGVKPYSVTRISGSLPGGFTLNSQTGIISGTTHDAAEVAAFTLRVTDAIGTFVDTLITIAVVASTNTTPLASALVGAPYSQQLTVGPGHDASTESWTLVGGSIPTGMTISTGGLLSGTPSGATGNYSFTAQVTAIFPGSTDPFSCRVPVTLPVGSSISLPKAYWKMEEAGGSRIDQIAGLALAPFNAEVTPRAAGKILFAADIITDGVSRADLFSGLAIPQMALGASGFTVAGWINVITLPAGDDMFLDAVWNNTTTFLPTWDARIQGGGINLFTVSGFDNVGTAYTVIAPIPIGSFFFFRSWFDPADTTVKVQINNGAILTSAPGLIFPAAPDGLFEITGVSLVGSEVLVDEIGYWTPALTTAEADSIYNAGSGRTCCPFS